MTNTQTVRINFDDVSKHFGTHKVIEKLNLSISRGEFVSLLGPSGSGKTTLLMILAGFETVTSGAVWLDDRRIEKVPAHRRDMGIVFQNYALFPHMTAAENIAFPLKRRGASKASIAEDVKRVLDMVQLSALADRKPSQMSGGQQQRIALARALVFAPKVVLMDEPLGALDKQLREQMQLDIRELHRRLGLTIVFVTHDQSEALTMSDRIAIFNKGRIEQVGAPEEVYDRPATHFVADFIGETNFLEGEVVGRNGDYATVRVAGGDTIRVRSSDAYRTGQKTMICIRPERIFLSADPSENMNVIATSVTDIVYQGDHLRVSLTGQGEPLIARSERRAPRFSVKSNVKALFAPDDCWMLPS